VLREYARSGAASIAVTNDPQSPLSEAADVTVELGAEPEEAVPATKAFTAEVVVITLIAEALGSVPWDGGEWTAVPECIKGILQDPGPADEVAATLREADGLISVGRGLLYPIALEAALKLKETSLLLAEGYSAADLRHGPIVVVEHGFPVLAFRVRGSAYEDMGGLIGSLTSRGARVLTVAQNEGADLSLPRELTEPFVAIPAAVRAQQLSLALATARGIDPDRPVGLSKITPTT
jgi:glutamine---fructose-6-phosphate transaminase (isomerizing)